MSNEPKLSPDTAYERWRVNRIIKEYKRSNEAGELSPSATIDDVLTDILADIKAGV